MCTQSLIDCCEKHSWARINKCNGISIARLNLGVPYRERKTLDCKTWYGGNTRVSMTFRSSQLHKVKQLLPCYSAASMNDSQSQQLIKSAGNCNFVVMKKTSHYCMRGLPWKLDVVCPGETIGALSATQPWKNTRLAFHHKLLHGWIRQRLIKSFTDYGTVQRDCFSPAYFNNPTDWGSLLTHIEGHALQPTYASIKNSSAPSQ